jgi:hypothetical protein
LWPDQANSAAKHVGNALATRNHLAIFSATPNAYLPDRPPKTLRRFLRKESSPLRTMKPAAYYRSTFRLANAKHTTRKFAGESWSAQVAQNSVLRSSNAYLPE